MKDFTKNEKKIIDKYYNELPDDMQIDVNNCDLLFEENLKKSIAELDIVNTENINVPNDFFSLINNAEEVKQKKSFKKEFAVFILTATVIISLFIFLILLIGPKLLIIYEAVILVILPISLIPLSKAVINRGESK